MRFEYSFSVGSVALHTSLIDCLPGHQVGKMTDCSLIPFWTELGEQTDRSIIPFWTQVGDLPDSSLMSFLT